MTFAACKAAGSHNYCLSRQRSNAAFPAALQAANVSLAIPRALPWAVTPLTLRAEEGHYWVKFFDYIHNNPVKGKLVDSAENYPHSSLQGLYS